MNQTKKSSFYKIWDVLRPFVIYYILRMVVFYLLAFLFQVGLEVLGESYADFVTTHEVTVNGIASGMSMLLAALPLVPMLKRELNDRRMQAGVMRTKPERTHVGSKQKELISNNGLQKHDISTNNSPEPDRSEKVLQTGSIFLIIILAVTASLGLNILFTISGLAEASGTFQNVSDRQFGVAFGVGVILYGIVSPLAEEIVFRGLLYNRMRKYCPVWLAIVVSGLLFGLYHGNLVQGIYGSCMGILMAYLYERTGTFRIPLLFHAVANLSVYMAACVPGLQGGLFQPVNCVILLTISICCIICLEKSIRIEKK